MPVDKIFLNFLAVELLFVVTGALVLVFALNTRAGSNADFTAENVASGLLLLQCPIDAAIANAALIFITFLSSIPAMVIPTTRGWLKAHGYLVVVCAIFTLVLGLEVWFSTLQTRANLLIVWNEQPDATQSLLQQTLNCCGYNNSTSPPFVTDDTCPNAQVAAANIGCVTPYSNFANGFLDLVFTGAFGFVGIDALLIMSIAILLKDRKEKQRYRHIDSKTGNSSF